MAYKPGKRSRENLHTVDPILKEIVMRAYELTDMDFTVTSGKRTREEQRRLVQKGASKTMRSKHLTGKAVDLVPYINGKNNYEEWSNYYLIAKAMCSAANELQVPIRWGGNWTYINHLEGEPRDWVQEYVNQRKKKGLSAFIDGAHFDLG